ncbi:glycosyltransferase family 4 protein [Candidatus Saccharibacteria bacterium]|nr:glycosyltransferase family 4 protein [Candidatus Saccharibacteria bacterium]
MKIAFFSDCYLDLTGGIVSLINAQKAALEHDGHTVYVFSTGYPKTKAKLQVLNKQNIFQVPSCKLFFYKLTPVSRRPKVVEKWLLQNYPEIQDFDIFYIHYESGCSIAGLRLGKKLGIPTVQVMHGREDMGEASIIPFGLRTIVAAALNWCHSWYLPHSVKIRRDHYLANTIAKAKMWTLMVNHANFADYVLTPSAHFAKKLTHYGVKKSIQVVPPGFADAKFIKDLPVKKLAPGKELKIIWHSRVSAEKRLLPFLQALRQVRGRYHLDVYGSGGDYWRAKSFVKRHQLNVTFHGNVQFDQLVKAMAKAHLDVLVSFNADTFGMTLIEAEAYNTPVFFCDPDMQEVVPRGGFAMSAGPSPAAMATALQDLLDHPEKLAKMSAVMSRHRSEFLISKRITLLEKIFQSAIKEPRD